MLNIIWIAFFLIAFLTALFKLIFLGDQQVFAQIMEAMFSLSKSAFEISLGLTGVLALWLGIMRIGESSGFIHLLTQSLTPLFSRLMPDVPKDHPALGAIVMNISANALGLDNAATPLGIKAMKELQTLNPNPEYRQQRANSVSGHQYLRGDVVSGNDFYLSRPTGRGQSHRCVHPDFDRDLYVDADRLAGRCFRAKNQFAG